MNILDLKRNCVSASLFSQGKAKDIFEEVEKDGMKVVMKQNKPICVLLSVEEYEKLTRGEEK